VRRWWLGAAVVLAAVPLCWAAEVTMSRSDVDRLLSEIAPHAQQLPLRFSSDSERIEEEKKLRRLLVFLDAATAQYPGEPELLLRAGIANSMGHNLDFPGCSDKAISAFEALLKLQPDSKSGNFYYGAFLAGTDTLRLKSIPYLEKAVSLGVSDAHYTEAFVYLSQQDKVHALAELSKYLSDNPADESAAALRRNLEHGDVSITEKKAKPSDAVLIQKPVPEEQTVPPSAK
jgi:tetratricopeptide (TPR) repeat protein